MNNKNNLQFRFDTFGFIALVMTFVSILFSFNLSLSDIITATSVFLIILATYIYISFKDIINQHAQEISKINEKINIYKDISDLKVKLEFLMNSLKMKKRGKGDLVEVFIRIVQIGAIIFATFIIFKALGGNF